MTKHNFPIVIARTTQKTKQVQQKQKAQITALQTTAEITAEKNRHAMQFPALVEKGDNTSVLRRPNVEMNKLANLILEERYLTRKDIEYLFKYIKLEKWRSFLDSLVRHTPTAIFAKSRQEIDIDELMLPLSLQALCYYIERGLYDSHIKVVLQRHARLNKSDLLECYEESLNSSIAPIRDNAAIALCYLNWEPKSQEASTPGETSLSQDLLTKQTETINALLDLTCQISPPFITKWFRRAANVSCFNLRLRGLKAIRRTVEFNHAVKILPDIRLKTLELVQNSLHTISCVDDLIYFFGKAKYANTEGLTKDSYRFKAKPKPIEIYQLKQLVKSNEQILLPEKDFHYLYKHIKKGNPDAMHVLFYAVVRNGQKLPRNEQCEKYYEEALKKLIDLLTNPKEKGKEKLKRAAAYALCCFELSDEQLKIFQREGLSGDSSSDKSEIGILFKELNLRATFDEKTAYNRDRTLCALAYLARNIPCVTDLQKEVQKNVLLKLNQAFSEIRENAAYTIGYYIKQCAPDSSELDEIDQATIDQLDPANRKEGETGLRAFDFAWQQLLQKKQALNVNLDVLAEGLSSEDLHTSLNAIKRVRAAVKGRRCISDTISQALLGMIAENKEPLKVNDALKILGYAVKNHAEIDNSQNNQIKSEDINLFFERIRDTKYTAKSLFLLSEIGKNIKTFSTETQDCLQKNLDGIYECLNSQCYTNMQKDFIVMLSIYVENNFTLSDETLSSLYKMNKKSQPYYVEIIEIFILYARNEKVKKISTDILQQLVVHLSDSNPEIGAKAAEALENYVTINKREFPSDILENLTDRVNDKATCAFALNILQCVVKTKAKIPFQIIEALLKVITEGTNHENCEIATDILCKLSKKQTFSKEILISLQKAMRYDTDHIASLIVVLKQSLLNKEAAFSDLKPKTYQRFNKLLFYNNPTLKMSRDIFKIFETLACYHGVVFRKPAMVALTTGLHYQDVKIRRYSISALETQVSRTQLSGTVLTSLEKAINDKDIVLDVVGVLSKLDRKNSAKELSVETLQYCVDFILRYPDRKVRDAAYVILNNRERTNKATLSEEAKFILKQEQYIREFTSPNSSLEQKKHAIQNIYELAVRSDETYQCFTLNCLEILEQALDLNHPLLCEQALLASRLAAQNKQDLPRQLLEKLALILKTKPEEVLGIVSAVVANSSQENIPRELIAAIENYFTLEKNEETAALILKGFVEKGHQLHSELMFEKLLNTIRNTPTGSANVVANAAVVILSRSEKANKVLENLAKNNSLSSDNLLKKLVDLLGDKHFKEVHDSIIVIIKRHAFINDVIKRKVLIKEQESIFNTSDVFGKQKALAQIEMYISSNLPSTLELLETALKDPNESIKEKALTIVEKLGSNISSGILSCLGDALFSEKLTRRAIRIIAKQAELQKLPDSVLRQVISILQDSNVNNLQNSARSILSQQVLLSYITDDAIKEIVVLENYGECLEKGDIKQKNAAAESLLSAVEKGKNLSAQVLTICARQLEDKDSSLRIKMAELWYARFKEGHFISENILTNMLTAFQKELLKKPSTQLSAEDKKQFLNMLTLLANREKIQCLKKLTDNSVGLLAEIAIDSEYSDENRHQALYLLAYLAKNNYQLPAELLNALETKLLDEKDKKLQANVYRIFSYSLLNGKKLINAVGFKNRLYHAMHWYVPDALWSGLSYLQPRQMVDAITNFMESNFIQETLPNDISVSKYELLCYQLKGNNEKEYAKKRFALYLKELGDYLFKKINDAKKEKITHLLELLYENKKVYQLDLTTVNYILLLLKTTPEVALIQVNLLADNSEEWLAKMEKRWLQSKLASFMNDRKIRFEDNELDKIIQWLGRDEEKAYFVNILLENIKQVDTVKQLYDFLIFHDHYKDYLKNSDIENFLGGKTFISCQRNLANLEKISGFFVGVRKLGLIEKDSAKNSEALFQLLLSTWSDWSVENILSLIKIVKDKSKSNELCQDILVQIRNYKMLESSKDAIVDVLEKNPESVWLEKLSELALNERFPGDPSIKSVDVLLEEFTNETVDNEKINEGKIALHDLELLKNDAIFDGKMKSLLLRDKGDIQSWSKDEIMDWAKLFKKQIRILKGEGTEGEEPLRQLNEEFLPEILAVINQAIALHFHDNANNTAENERAELRKTQVLALLGMLNEKEGNKGRLAQVATGEGKSIIIAALAVIKALQGEHVDIITSSPVLAKEGAKQFKSFYALFGLNVSNNTAGDYSGDGVRPCYKDEINIVYGDASNFQFDTLRHDFSQLNTRAKRRHDIVIVDEVDNVLIDEGAKQAMLAELMPAMNYLEPVYIAIWDHLNRLIEEKIKVPSGIKIDTTEERDRQKELLQKELKKVIQEIKVSPEQRKKLAKDIEEHIKKLVIISKDPITLTDTQTNIVIPKHLKEFYGVQLQHWIDSALTAKFDYELNVHYDFHKDEKNRGCIAPVDHENTGVTQLETQWGNGLHQFLQLKHELTLTPETVTTNYLSNRAYFARYKSLYGLTGTLGTKSTRALLEKTYHVDNINIPTYKEKRFHEYDVLFAEQEDDWLEEIVRSIKREINNGRPVLIICETIKKADAIKEKLEKEKHYLSKDGNKAIDIKSYARSHTQDIRAIEKPVNPGDVIIATNLAGRGTDLKLAPSVKVQGGLHVCLTYCPPERVKKQALGRTSRQGELGTGQLILDKSDFYGCDNLARIEKAINQANDERIKEFADNVLAALERKDKLFNNFCELFKELASNAEQDNESIPSNFFERAEKYRIALKKQYKLKAIQERWGIWLKENEDKKNAEAEFEKFSQMLTEEYKENTVIKNPLYLINYANDLIDYLEGWRYKINLLDIKKSGLYQHINQILEQAITLDEKIAYNAHYTKLYSLMKQKSDKAKLKNELETTKDIISREIIPQLQNTLKRLQRLDPKSDLIKQQKNKFILLHEQINRIDRALSVIKKSKKLIDFEVKGAKEGLFIGLPKDQALEVIRTKLSNNSKCTLKFHDLRVVRDMHFYKLRSDPYKIVEKAPLNILGVARKISIKFPNMSPEEAKKLLSFDDKDRLESLLKEEEKPDETTSSNAEEKNNESKSIFKRIGRNTKERKRAVAKRQVSVDIRNLKLDEIEACWKVKKELCIHINGLPKEIKEVLARKLKCQHTETALSFKVKDYKALEKKIKKIQSAVIESNVELIQEITADLSWPSLSHKEAIQLVESTPYFVDIEYPSLSRSEAESVIYLNEANIKNSILKIRDIDRTQALKILEANVSEEKLKNPELKPVEKTVLDASCKAEIEQQKNNGLYWFLELEEKGCIPVASIATLTTLATAQLALGIGLTFVTSGFAVNFGIGLMAEAVSDLIYAGQVYKKRECNWKYYGIQKTSSLALCAITAGFSAATLAKDALQVGDNVAIKVTQLGFQEAGEEGIEQAAKTAIAKVLCIQFTKQAATQTAQTAANTAMDILKPNILAQFGADIIVEVIQAVDAMNLDTLHMQYSNAVSLGGDTKLIQEKLKKKVTCLVNQLESGFLAAINPQAILEGSGDAKKMINTFSIEFDKSLQTLHGKWKFIYLLNKKLEANQIKIETKELEDLNKFLQDQRFLDPDGHLIPVSDTEKQLRTISKLLSREEKRFPSKEAVLQAIGSMYEAFEEDYSEEITDLRRYTNQVLVGKIQALLGTRFDLANAGLTSLIGFTADKGFDLGTSNAASAHMIEPETMTLKMKKIAASLSALTFQGALNYLFLSDEEDCDLSLSAHVETETSDKQDIQQEARSKGSALHKTLDTIFSDSHDDSNANLHKTLDCLFHDGIDELLTNIVTYDESQQKYKLVDDSNIFLSFARYFFQTPIMFSKACHEFYKNKVQLQSATQLQVEIQNETFRSYIQRKATQFDNSPEKLSQFSKALLDITGDESALGRRILLKNLKAFYGSTQEQDIKQFFVDGGLFDCEGLGYLAKVFRKETNIRLLQSVAVALTEENPDWMHIISLVLKLSNDANMRHYLIVKYKEIADYINKTHQDTLKKYGINLSTCKFNIGKLCLGKGNFIKNSPFKADIS